MTEKDTTTFVVAIHGAALPEETTLRINEAMGRAALAEIATMDLRGKELVFRPVMARLLAADDGGGGGGGTGGGAHIELRSESI